MGLGACLLLGAAALAKPGVAADAGQASTLAKRPALRVHWPDLEVLNEIDVPGTTRVGERAVLLHALKVHGRRDDVLRAYYQAFRQSGLYMARPGELPQLSNLEVGLAAIDVYGWRSYVIVLQPESRDITNVILGYIDLAVRVARSSSSGLPVMPGATAPLETSMEGARSVAFDVHAKLAEVGSYYGSVLTHAGFQQEPEDGSAPATWRFTRPGRTVDVRAEPGQADRLHVTLLDRGAPEEESEGLAEADVAKAGKLLDEASARAAAKAADGGVPARR